MKKAALLAVSLGLGACAPHEVVAPRTAGPAPQRPGQIPNIEVVVIEVVDSAEADELAYTEISIDGEPAGRTTAGPRSSERRWSARLPRGNHLLKMEQWRVSPTGEASPLAEELQPRERFVSVDAGQKTKIQLRVSEQGRRQDQTLSREKLPD